MAAGTIWFGWRGFQLTSDGSKTQGTVVHMEESTDGDGACCVYSPVVEYQAAGRTYTFDSMNASDPPRFKVGDQVNIVYSNADPSNAEIDSWFDLWLVPSLLCPATILVAVLLNWLAISKIRKGEPIWDSDD
jgi:hypothetical protein